MNSFSVALDAFHLLRPLWLILLVPLLLVWWRVRSAQTQRAAPQDGLAPHLRDALMVGATERARILPIDMVALALALLAVGASGPTWSRQPDPFVAQSAPLVVALEVTPSMEAADVAPNRLERGKQKIRDLLELRDGARTALVAYAGSAHVAVPMTEDPGVVLPYLIGLLPEVLPEEGNRAGDALAQARALLAREEGPGAVLFVTDGIDPADAAALSSEDVLVLAMLPQGQGDRGLDSLTAATVIPVTPDPGDVEEIDGLLDAAQARALLDDENQPWVDRGVWLAWPAALIVLLWFRQGWTMRWAMIAGLSLALSGTRAEADGIVDWFFTPDQQGRLAFDDKEYERAAELFIDPLWRGYALYRDGQYAEAADLLARVETAQAAFIQGMAHIKSRDYRDGVRAFETALTRDPDYPGAAQNLEVAKRIVDYVEDAREQSDTGETGGIGADEVVFDNEAARGAETQIEVPEEEAGPVMLTTEQWMNTVDTRTSDFLRSRFALEAARGSSLTDPEATEAEASE